jgi:bacillithiol system protein YtxJ
MKKITSAEEAEAVLASSEAIVFKHSTRCPVSTHALGEVREFVRRHPESPVHLVDVIASRQLSRWIGEATGVPHESPQLIVLKGGRVVFSTSHEGVTVEALEAAVRKD